MNKQITEHFSFDGDKNIVCPHCQAVKLTDIFWRHMEMLEKVRMELNQPIIINSGYRCPYHNKKVEGSKGSWHMKFATDIRPKWPSIRQVSMGVPEYEEYQQVLVIRLRKIAEDIGFTGIGIYNSFVHLDTRPKFTTWRG